MEKVRKKPLDTDTEMPISKQYTTTNGEYSTCIWQLDKHQDFVLAIGNNMIVADGHGTDIVSDWLKSLSDNVWEDVFNQTNPLSYLNNMLLKQSFSTVGSGACVTIVKTYSTYVEVFYTGDTKAQVYINQKKIKETDKHDASNPKEKARVRSNGAYLVKEKMMEVLKPSNDKVRLTQVMGERVRFDKHTFLQMTQCIGHSRQETPGTSNTSETGYFRVDFNEMDDVKVIAGSDGVWDVTHESVNLSLYKNAESIAHSSCLNWYNDFEFVHPEDHQCSKCKSKKEKDDEVVSIQKGLASDDISVCMWHKKVLNKQAGN
jgi:serine/threonine protein phosphatase PrpC